MLDSAVRGIVIRSGIAHGRGAGIPGLLAGVAGDAGHGLYLGGPDTTWAVVHVEDLARLVALALEFAPAGAIRHGVSESAVSVVDVAAAADRAAGGVGVARWWEASQAAETLGEDFAEALATSQNVTATRAVELGWVPVGVDLVADLMSGSYVREPARTV